MFSIPDFSESSRDTLLPSINAPSGKQITDAQPVQTSSVRQVLPARLRKLDNSERQDVVALQEAAEERGRVLIEQAMPDALLEATDGPIVPDEWDDLAGDDDDDDEQVQASLENPLPGAPQPIVQPEPTSLSSVPELEADPFHCPEIYNRSEPDTPDQSAHFTPAIRLLYILVSWLHTHFHLPFVACNAVLIVVYNILHLAGSSLSSTYYRTLPSVIDHLNVEPKFLALPVCPGCQRLFPPSTDPNIPCPFCKSPIFMPTISNTKKSTKTSHRPLLQFPYKSLESQLRDILEADGMEEAAEAWRLKERRAGVYRDMFDGEICKELPGPDGEPFFQNPLPPDNTELRIALTQGVDWFSYLRSLIAPSHSSGPMTFNIANFEPHIKYRTSNVLLGGILPGPKEQTGDQVQFYQKVFVNELLRLYYIGFTIRTKRYPDGRLVRVVLVCVICDKPAAVKLGGFGSHSHTFFCHRCWIQQLEKATAAAFQQNAFPPRSHEEHAARGSQYANLENETLRKAFVKEFAARWAELSRLPYFNLCRMIVIDPMHNLILGLIKTHFYNIWVQLKVLRKTKELRRFHDLLSKLQLPSFLGRLPALMGEPAGGSLTADQWLIAATIVCPLLLPQIWEEYCPSKEDADYVLIQRLESLAKAVDAKKKAQAAARRAAKAAEQATRDIQQATSQVNGNSGNSRSKRKRKPTARAKESAEYLQKDSEAAMVTDEGEHEVDPDEDWGSEASKRQRIAGGEIDEEDKGRETEPTIPNLHPDDLPHFFKLTEALKLICAYEFTDDDIEDADRLLREYCTDLLRLYGPSVIKPNHHFATHTALGLRDFGPIRGYWTFLFERINKVLKSYNSANHSGGELEVSFFREFHRTVQQSRVMSSALTDGCATVKDSIEAMYKATNDDRGTVQALARDLDTVHPDGGIKFQLGTRSRILKKERLSLQLYQKLLAHLQLIMLDIPKPLTSYLDTRSDGVILTNMANMYDYVIIHGRRYWTTRASSLGHNSLIAVLIDGQYYVGELLLVLLLEQQEIGRKIYGHVRWQLPASQIDLSDTYWPTSKRLGMSFWQYDRYQPEDGEGPSPLIPLDCIIGPAVRTEVAIQNQKFWLTMVLPQN